MKIRRLIKEEIGRKEMVLVDNSKSIDIKFAHLYDTQIRPRIKNEMIPILIGF
jgi:hypothetical protein